MRQKFFNWLLWGAIAVGIFALILVTFPIHSSAQCSNVSTAINDPPPEGFTLTEEESADGKTCVTTVTVKDEPPPIEPPPIEPPLDGETVLDYIPEPGHWQLVPSTNLLIPSLLERYGQDWADLHGCSSTAAIDIVTNWCGAVYDTGRQHYSIPGCGGHGSVCNAPGILHSRLMDLQSGPQMPYQPPYFTGEPWPGPATEPCLTMPYGPVPSHTYSGPIYLPSIDRYFHAGAAGNCSSDNRGPQLYLFNSDPTVTPDQAWTLLDMDINMLGYPRTTVAGDNLVYWSSETNQVWELPATQLLTGDFTPKRAGAAYISALGQTIYHPDLKRLYHYSSDHCIGNSCLYVQDWPDDGEIFPAQRLTDLPDWVTEYAGMELSENGKYLVFWTATRLALFDVETELFAEAFWQGAGPPTTGPLADKAVRVFSQWQRLEGLGTQDIFMAYHPDHGIYLHALDTNQVLEWEDLREGWTGSPTDPTDPIDPTDPNFPKTDEELISPSPPPQQPHVITEWADWETRRHDPAVIYSYGMDDGPHYSQGRRITCGAYETEEDCPLVKTAVADFAIQDQVVTRATGSFIKDGFALGMTVTCVGCADDNNREKHLVQDLTDTAMRLSIKNETRNESGSFQIAQVWPFIGLPELNVSPPIQFAAIKNQPLEESVCGFPNENLPVSPYFVPGDGEGTGSLGYAVIPNCNAVPGKFYASITPYGGVILSPEESTNPNREHIKVMYIQWRMKFDCHVRWFDCDPNGETYKTKSRWYDDGNEGAAKFKLLILSDENLPELPYNWDPAACGDFQFYVNHHPYWAPKTVSKCHATWGVHSAPPWWPQIEDNQPGGINHSLSQVPVYLEDGMVDPNTNNWQSHGPEHYDADSILIPSDVWTTWLLRLEVNGWSTEEEYEQCIRQEPGACKSRITLWMGVEGQPQSVVVDWPHDFPHPPPDSPWRGAGRIWFSLHFNKDPNLVHPIGEIKYDSLIVSREMIPNPL